MAVEDSEAAAVFFMGVGGADGAGWEPAGLEDEAPAVAALTLLVAEAVEAAAGWAGFAAETFFAADTACLATAVFLTAGFEAGLALATGFFTVTGSFDELETHIQWMSPPWISRVLANGEPKGYTPENDPRTHAVLCRKSHTALKEGRGGSRNRRAIV
ncbi:hypothetical protein [Variovorax sp. HW608]|uniref:hypothetical protein n=1 Tax=Variovorax sp. HW608 TaxID=1034889 RepID=UPI000B5AC8D0